MNSDQTKVSGNKRRKIHVPIKGSLARKLKENRGKAGLAAGIIAATAFMSAKDIQPLKGKSDEPLPEIPPVTEAEITENDGAYLSIDPGDQIHQSDQGLSFSEAFKDARETMGPGGIFEWNDKFYNTYFEEEWENLSEDQQNEYAAKVNDSIRGDNSEIIESTKGEIATVEFSPDNVLTITLENGEVIASMEELHIDLNNDGRVDLTLNIESSIKEPSTPEEVLQGKDLVVDSREGDVIELDLDENPDLTFHDGAIELDFDDVPDREANQWSDKDEFRDEDGYPDIDEFNEELLH